MEEEYILSGQPIELLVKQLSRPSVTLEDIERFCATNREIRELCLTNPLFQRLKEGKKRAVRISRLPRDTGDIFDIYIYSYVGNMKMEISFTMITSRISDILENIKSGDEVILSGVKFVLVLISQNVLINQTAGGGGEDGDVLIIVPYVLFESILIEMQRMVDREEVGDLRILVNGDVQYVGVIEE